MRKIVKKATAAEQQIVQIARSMAHDFRVLILDEPTSSISADEAQKLINILKRLKSSGKSIIYISHKMEEVFNLADAITILRDGRKIGTYGIGEITQNEVIEKMAGRELSSLVLGRKVRRDLREAEVLLKVEDLSGVGFSGINFELRDGEILGFAGLVGAGRTEIAKTIIGGLPRLRGRVTIGGRAVKPGNLPDATRAGNCLPARGQEIPGHFLNPQRPGEHLRFLHQSDNRFGNRVPEEGEQARSRCRPALQCENALHRDLHQSV